MSGQPHYSDFELRDQNEVRPRDQSSGACTLLHTSALTATHWAARYRTTTSLLAMSAALLLLLLLLCELAWQQLVSLPRSAQLLDQFKIYQAPSRQPSSVDSAWPCCSWHTGQLGLPQTFLDISYRSRPGPKSRNCSTGTASVFKFMLFVLLLGLQVSQAAAVDVRVPTTPKGSGSTTPSSTRDRGGEVR